MISALPYAKSSNLLPGVLRPPGEGGARPRRAGTPLPPGYTYAKVPGHGKLLVRKEPEATVITEALEWFARGRFPSQVDVQRFLQEKGFNHWETGKMAYLEQVKRLLTREVYTGYVSYL